MKIGICTDINNAERLAKLKDKNIFSEIELSCGYISKLSSDELNNIIKIKEATGFKTSAVNCLMAGTSATLFTDNEFEQSKQYLNELAKKLEMLSVKIVVFGSGGYRKVPEGVSDECAFAKISEFMVVLCDIMKQYNIIVVIEPLNSSECNVLNTTTEAMRYISTLNINNLRLLVDYYHFDTENELMSSVHQYKPYISHIHIAALKTRKYMTTKDKESCAEFINAVKDIDCIISLEGSCDNFDSDIQGVIEFYDVLGI